MLNPNTIKKKNLSEKGSTLKGRNLLPVGKQEQEATEVVFLVQNGVKSTRCSHSL